MYFNSQAKINLPLRKAQSYFMSSHRLSRLFLNGFIVVASAMSLGNSFHVRVVRKQKAFDCNPRHPSFGTLSYNCRACFLEGRFRGWKDVDRACASYVLKCLKISIMSPLFLRYLSVGRLSFLSLSAYSNLSNPSTSVVARH